MTHPIRHESSHFARKPSPFAYARVNNDHRAIYSLDGAGGDKRRIRQEILTNSAEKCFATLLGASTLINGPPVILSRAGGALGGDACSGLKPQKSNTLLRK